MTLSDKALRTLQDDGFTGLLRKATLYITRRVEQRVAPWNERLDYKVSGRAIYRQHQTMLARNEIFRNRHRGLRCFVIGNGPSINQQDLASLAAELTFVTNAFCRHPIVDQWQPSYYFLSDPAYFNRSEAAQEEFSQIVARVPETTYFVPHQAREVIEQDALMPPEQTYYVALAGALARDPPWEPDFTRVQPGVQTVAQLAIMGAMYMGCSPIYLLGLDHDWLAHANTHYTFYTGDEADKHDWKYGDLMEAVLKMWRGYESIQRMARAQGVQIVNVTRGGFLDIFERGNYESVIQS